MSSTLTEAKARELWEAQEKAQALFDEIGRKGLIRPTVTEKTLNDEIYALAEEMFDVKTYWHKRIVRSGPNTLFPYADKPPDRFLTEDDIVFLDFGPVFEQWEADFGRTFVLGHDPLKHRLQMDAESAFREGKKYFAATPHLKASELYHWVVRYGEERNWEFGGAMAGHFDRAISP